MPKFSECSKQYRYQITMKGMGRCPICGGKPSSRSPKGRYCEKHVEARAARERRRIGCKSKFVKKATWLEIDWTMGAKLIALMLGVTRQTVKSHYKRLRVMQKIKPVPGFIQPVGGAKVRK